MIQGGKAMGTHGRIGRILTATLGCIGTLTLAKEARAIQYGELRIRTNTTLVDDRYGDVAFDASNITLDCANHQIHISSTTKLNEGVKAAIFADGKSGIRIRNCTIVGGFDDSLFIQSGTSVIVTNVTASTPAVFAFNQSANVTGLNLHTSDVALFIENDITGTYSASIRCGFEGIHVDGSSRTSIINTSVSGCTDYAMTAEDDNTLTIHSVDLENNFGGLGITSSSNVDVRNSIFNNNSTEGLAVTTTNSFFGANTALGNGECDAFEDPSSSGDVWVSNTFGTTCGSVPAAH
jgi:nitrous oxidase accessory protein NosD